ncbi:hypothetical protein GCM10011534_00680 [Pseudooceanicola nanhaiensis]|jgi:putative lipoprotein|uniref:DUF306 domain-containing protein n=1 Tax=Pseudooceanicola nanhaiensis TaxID=375761 RepID=A0A917SIY5_9RHOB|nr:META domain-containing protein [Pseudooceanicola nanhaiensis]GGL82463.1 hypothetical protein GCM10011534_00680 [Pseudooceanicola nanhaiensis]
MKTCLAAALALALPAAPALAEIATVEVTATYAGEAPIPEGAILAVELRDVSKADAPSVTLSLQMLTVAGMPVTVALPYEDTLIDDRMTYAVAARLLSGDTVVARTTTSNMVLTRDAGDSVEIALEPMQTRQTTTPEPIPASVTWNAFEVGGRMLIVDTPPTLTVTEDGTVSVFAGCNQFTGQAEMTEGGFVVSQPMAGTRKACPPPVMELEAVVIDALGNTAGYVLNGDLLTLVNAYGVPTIRFSRAED